MLQLIEIENFTGIRLEKEFIPSNTFGFWQNELTDLLNPEKQNNDILYKKFNLKKDIFKIKKDDKFIEIKEAFGKGIYKTTDKFTFINGNVIGIY